MRSSTSWGLAGQGLGDAVGEAVGDFGLGHAGPGFGAGGGDERDLVGRAAHDAGFGADVVGENPVAAFAPQLGGGVGDDVVGFGGEADDQTRPVGAGAGERGQDVGVGDEGERMAGRCRPF